MKNHTIITVILLILFSATALIVFNKNITKNKSVKEKTVNDILPTVVPTIDPNGGMISLERLHDNRTNYVTVAISIDSKIHNVSGFDVVLEYNPADIIAEEFIQSIEDYQVFTGSKKGEYSIGAVRKLTVGKPAPLNKEIIGTLVFKKLQDRKTNINIKFLPKTTADSNIINEKSEDVLSSVTGLTIN